MRWLERNPTLNLQECILLADDGAKVGRVVGTCRSWRWAVGIEGLKLVLYRGQEWSMEDARDRACSAARQIELILHASWVIQPDGGRALMLRGRPLVAAWRVTGVDAPPGREPWDWQIPGTCIGGEVRGMLQACVVATREAASYWGKVGPRALDPPPREQANPKISE